MNNKLNIQAIFDSVDGEANGFGGAGELTTFIRLKGCNLRCSFCDTKYAQNSIPENWMEAEEICEQVHFEKVTITGGEPLLAGDDLISLIRLLLDKGNKITIETNGSIEIPKDFFGTFLHRLRFVVDFKLPSSGVMEHMNSTIFSSLRAIDIIKFVISDEEDYKYAKMLIHNHPISWKAIKVFSPVLGCLQYQYGCGGAPIKETAYFNMFWPRQLAEMMIRDKVDAQLSLQLHKVLWPGAKQER